MAFYRCGGGSGIPSQVNTDMNNVLNKKFSTSGQTYPPLEWADDVNLLGLLEEKTASGAIAHIEDGADEVPVKSWQVTLPASLSGYSAVNGVRTGKNLWNVTAITNTTNPNNATIVNNGNGTITVTTTTQQNVKTAQKLKDICPNVKVGETYFLNATTTGNQKIIYLHQAAVSWTYGTAKVITSQMLESDVSLYASGTNSTATISDLSLTYGSTATAYEAYTAPTQYTASLGRTIYGGTADIVNGQGTDGYIKYVIDGVNNYAVNVSGTNFNIMPYGLFIDGTVSKWLCDTLTASSTNFGYNSSQGFIFIRQAGWSSIAGVSDVATFNAYCQENPITLILPLTTATDFTFTPITPIPETPLGVSNWWADEGDSAVTYRSSGTVTPVPVVPTLISKTITENGTYSAEDDDADGYSEVTVNVQGGGEEPFVPQFTETLIADNSAHASSFTLTEDYGNYDMVKIVWYESSTVSGFLYTTPDILDEIFSIGVGKLCINKPSTNYYACYTKSGLTWTRSNQRVIDVHEIYGVTFTNCTMQATDLYKRGASTTTKYAVTSQTSLKDYDLFMMASIHATDGSETMPATWLYQYPPENMSGAFSCPVPTVLQEYNANDEAFVISEYGMTAARYFMVQGIVFTPSTSNLLSMGGLTSSNEEPTEPENNEEEEE